MEKYDLIIIGAGPAGCSAAVYARRFNMNVLVLYENVGGLIATAHQVENWPGIEMISGFELGKQFYDHAVKLGVEGKQSKVDCIEKKNDDFLVKAGNEEYKGKNVLIASGTLPRQLGIPGEKEFLGKGVSYCAVCDGNFFRGKTLAVIGGSDSACNDVGMLADIAEKVYLIYRREKLRAEDANVRQVENNPKVEVIYKAVPNEIKGSEKVEEIVLDNGQKLKVDGVFVAIGREPLTAILDKVEVDFTDRGEIMVDDKKMTKTPGLFAAGDVIPGIKQAITAAGYGVEAIFGLRDYLKSLD